MKNNLLIPVLLLTANAGQCAPAAANIIFNKFLFVMLGVILSSLIIFICILLYKKINYKKEEISEILTHPKTKDAAIDFFIRKNKIQ